MRNVDEASVLQAAAVFVAAPRYMGAFAYSLGVDIVRVYPWFINVEIGSAVALAVLEGWAIAYVVRAIRRQHATSVHTKRLVALLVILLALLPAIGTPYMVGVGAGKPATGIMHIGWIWAWKFVINAVVPIFVAAVGYASGVTSRTQPVRTVQDVNAQPVKKVAVRATRVHTNDINNRRTHVLDALKNGHVQVSELAKSLGVHRNTITNDLRALQRDGVVKRNGNGWEVVE